MTTQNFGSSPAQNYAAYAIRNYINRTQSMHSSWIEEPPPLYFNKYEMLIVIGAPTQIIDNTCYLLLYIDYASSPVRQLSKNAWQVRCEESLGSDAFATWADEVAHLLIKLVTEQWMVCVDLSDIRIVMSQGLNRQTTCLLCDWPDQHQLPQIIETASFSHAVAALFSHAEYSETEIFGTAGDLLEQTFQNNGIYIFAARRQTGAVPRLLIFGVK